MKIHAKITLENGLITKKLISDSRVYELLAILNYLFAPLQYLFSDFARWPLFLYYYLTFMPHTPIMASAMIYHNMNLSLHVLLAHLLPLSLWFGGMMDRVTVVDETAWQKICKHGIAGANLSRSKFNSLFLKGINTLQTTSYNFLQLPKIVWAKTQSLDTHPTRYTRQ